MQHEKRVAAFYWRELWLPILECIVLLFGSIHFGQPMTEGAMRAAISVTAMAGFGLMIRAIARHLSRIDEYHRARLSHFALILGRAGVAEPLRRY